jgi:hypothetical protein
MVRIARQPSKLNVLGSNPSGPAILKFKLESVDHLEGRRLSGHGNLQLFSDLNVLFVPVEMEN